MGSMTLLGVDKSGNRVSVARNIAELNFSMATPDKNRNDVKKIEIDTKPIEILSPEQLRLRKSEREKAAKTLAEFQRKKYVTVKQLCTALGRNPEDIRKCATIAQLEILAKTGQAPL